MVSLNPQSSWRSHSDTGLIGTLLHRKCSSSLEGHQIQPSQSGMLDLTLAYTLVVIKSSWTLEPISFLPHIFIIKFFLYTEPKCVPLWISPFISDSCLLKLWGMSLNHHKSLSCICKELTCFLSVFTFPNQNLFLIAHYLRQIT